MNVPLRLAKGYISASQSASVSLIPIAYSSGAALQELSDPFAGYEDYATPNWDGYGAQPILPSIVATPRHFYHFIAGYLRFGLMPNIAPGSDGTIAFEWRVTAGPIRKLFVEVQPEPRATRILDRPG